MSPCDNHSIVTMVCLELGIDNLLKEVSNLSCNTTSMYRMYLWLSNFFVFNSQVNYIAYSDEISSLIGARPNLWHLFLTDPKLAFKCYFGPCVPAQYRLVGPGSWKGARDVIMGVEESRVCPLRTRKTGLKEEERKNSYLLWILGLVVVVTVLLLML